MEGGADTRFGGFKLPTASPQPQCVPVWTTHVCLDLVRFAFCWAFVLIRARVHVCVCVEVIIWQFKKIRLGIVSDICESRCACEEYYIKHMSEPRSPVAVYSLRSARTDCSGLHKNRHCCLSLSNSHTHTDAHTADSMLSCIVWCCCCWADRNICKPPLPCKGFTSQTFPCGLITHWCALLGNHLIDHAVHKCETK